MALTLLAALGSALVALLAMLAILALTFSPALAPAAALAVDSSADDSVRVVEDPMVGYDRATTRPVSALSAVAIGAHLANETGEVLVASETYCPTCLAEARVRFPTLEPQPGASPLTCARHLRATIVRRPAKLRLAHDRIIERQILDVDGYAHLYAATDEEIAASGWARCLWN
ncbi:MAG TPA: hypothetical protein VKQ30_25225 [Ktedonobacterales bacterium]|nr:hypothetical protein [Ktedonobacterales bacterium]